MAELHAVDDSMIPPPKWCEICGGTVEWLEEYQQYVGRAWRGHKECATDEADKWVLVEKADLRLAANALPLGMTPLARRLIALANGEES